VAVLSSSHHERHPGGSADSTGSRLDARDGIDPAWLIGRSGREGDRSDQPVRAGSALI
jgi:hypothetical protein